MITIIYFLFFKKTLSQTLSMGVFLMLSTQQIYRRSAATKEIATNLTRKCQKYAKISVLWTTAVFGIYADNIWYKIILSSRNYLAMQMKMRKNKKYSSITSSWTIQNTPAMAPSILICNSFTKTMFYLNFNTPTSFLVKHVNYPNIYFHFYFYF
jgi:hypothetical protein